MFLKQAGYLIGVAALVLAGCGGGESTGSTAATLKISGTAATGAALAGATVTAHCAGGSGSATTGTDGRFSIDLGSAGELPCVLRATTAATVLHGALYSGTAANVTPLTELVLSRAGGGTAAALFDNFDAAAQGRINGSNLGSALEAVRSALQGRVDLGSTDPLTVTFAVGDAHDRKLDGLMLSLTQARTSLAKVASALTASGSTPGTVATLLQPAAAACRSLRSGSYRLVGSSAANDSPTGLQVDAGTLRFTLPDATQAVQLTAAAEDCSFTFPDLGGTSRALVSASGMTVLLRQRVGGAPSTDVSLAVPKQEVPLSALAGTWTLMEYAREEEQSPFEASLISVALAADGTLNALRDCLGSNCTNAGGQRLAVLTPHADGGFTYSLGGQTVRVFAFQTADGHLTMAMHYPDRSGWAIATKQQILDVPVAGRVLKLWNFTAGSDGFASALSRTELTSQGGNANTQYASWTRTADGLLDLWRLNTPPWPGVYFAMPMGCLVDVDVQCDSRMALELPGTGVTVYAGRQGAYLGIWVNRP